MKLLNLIKVTALASSSKNGTCIMIDDGITKILLDMGMNSINLQSSLFKLGVTSKDISGALITHEHGDHISGANALTIKKYLTQKTWENSKTLIMKSRVEFISPNVPFRIGTWTIKPFSTNHDAADPVGFVMINGNGEKLFYMTDSGTAPAMLRNADIYIIEANHSEASMTKQINYFEETNNIQKIQLLQRVMNTHFSNEKCLEYLKEAIGEKTKQVILMHMSSREYNPVLKTTWFKKMLKFEKINFIHPQKHKIKRSWKLGYEPVKRDW